MRHARRKVRQARKIFHAAKQYLPIAFFGDVAHGDDGAGHFSLFNKRQNRKRYKAHAAACRLRCKFIGNVRAVVLSAVI